MVEVRLSKPEEEVRLHFGAAKSKKALRNFSAGTRVGNTLFLAADERCDIDQLSRCDAVIGIGMCKSTLAIFWHLLTPTTKSTLKV